MGLGERLGGLIDVERLVTELQIGRLLDLTATDFEVTGHINSQVNKVGVVVRHALSLVWMQFGQPLGDGRLTLGH